MTQLCGSRMAHANCRFQNNISDTTLHCDAPTDTYSKCEYADKIGTFTQTETLSPERKIELRSIINAMLEVVDDFYAQAIMIGNHPFIEFNGLQREYIKCCLNAYEQGIDFTQCNTHTGQVLPMQSYEVDYANSKMECIFTGRSVLSENVKPKEYILKIAEDHSFTEDDLEKLNPHLGHTFNLEILMGLNVCVYLSRLDGNILYIDHPYAK